MSLTWYEIGFPNNFDADAVLRFARTLAVRARHGLLMTSQPVVLELENVDEKITWRLGVTSQEHDQVIMGLRQALPDARLEAVDQRAQRFDRVWELRLNSHNRPLATDFPEQVAGAVLSAMLQVGNDERLLLQWLIGPWLTRQVVPPPQAKQRSGQSPLDLPKLLLDSEQTQELREKLSEPLFGVVGRIGVSASTEARRRMLRQALMGALQLARAPGVGIDRRLIPGFLASRRLMKYQRPMVTWPLALNAKEVTTPRPPPFGSY